MLESMDFGEVLWANDAELITLMVTLSPFPTAFPSIYQLACTSFSGGTYCSMVALIINDLDPLWLAQSRLRRQRYNEAIEILDTILSNKPLDQV